MKLIAYVQAANMTTEKVAALIKPLGWKLGTEHPSEEDGYFEVEIPDGLIKGKFFEGFDSEYHAEFEVGGLLIEIGDPDNDSWCCTDSKDGLDENGNPIWIGEGRF